MVKLKEVWKYKKKRNLEKHGVKKANEQREKKFKAKKDVNYEEMMM